MGTIGFALDGVAIYGPFAELSAQGPIARDAVIYEGSSLGDCGSHNSGNGTLHYHALPGIKPSTCSISCSPSGPSAGPSCNHKGVLCADEIPASDTLCSALTSGATGFFGSTYQPSAQAFGNAAGSEGSHSLLLGFLADGVPLYGLYGKDGTEPSDLDACNGHSSDLGFYHYHAIRTFPYIVGCLRGRMKHSNNNGPNKWSGQMYAMQNSCSAGYDTYDYSAIMNGWAYPVVTVSVAVSLDTGAAATTWSLLVALLVAAALSAAS